MTDAPKRYKDRDDLTMDEELEVVQARRRGEREPKFETADYKRAKREALADAGLAADDDPPEPKNIEEMSVGEHYDRIRRR